MGDSPCDRGLHFARTMTPLACAGWLGGRKALPRGVASWQWPRSMTAARAQRQPASAGSQTIRDWVLRFNAHGPEGLADRQAPGHPGKLNTVQRQALAAMVESGRGVSDGRYFAVISAGTAASSFAKRNSVRST